MLYKHITKEEARTLAELGSVPYNRYRNANRNNHWNKEWSDWKGITDWGVDDWDALDPTQWEDEFRVEVE